MSTLAGEDERLRGYKLGVDDFIAKPFRPEELVARVDRVVSRSQRSPGAIGGSVDKKSLRGDLEQVGLPSVLGFLEMERKTGILLVIGDRPARLFLRDGRPLRVEIGSPDASASQEELALELLGWTAGQFEFAAQDVPDDNPLQTTLTALLLEHARRADEAAR
jgi:DNA-binding response OmpR family regulator